jgi:hypothetical protein
MKNLIRNFFFPLLSTLFLAVCVSAQAPVGEATSLSSGRDPVYSPADPKEATPHRPDGQPDLDGVWTIRTTVNNDGGGNLPSVINKDGSVSAFLPSRKGGLYSAEIDGALVSKGDRNKPMYKPENWAKVRDLELHSLKTDPQYKCLPYGVPRMGEPQQIIQQTNQLVFLYSGYPSLSNAYRVIPLNRPHDPGQLEEETYKGDSVGRWEGDTLVVDTIGFNDETWLTAKLGYFHSTDLHVVERFTRHGNKMEYQVTVDDPKVLLQPWVWEPRTMALNSDPNAKLPEDYPCSERDVDDTDVR